MKDLQKKIKQSLRKRKSNKSKLRVPKFFESRLRTDISSSNTKRKQKRKKSNLSNKTTNRSSARKFYRKETEEEKEKRLALAYLTRTIKLFESSDIQNLYVAQTLEDLYYVRDNIDDYYKIVREFQKNKQGKINEYVNKINNQLLENSPTKGNPFVNYKETKIEKSQVKRIIRSWNWETIEIVRHADDRLLWDIEHYYPPQRGNFEDVDDYMQAKQASDAEFSRLCQAFIEKYGVKYETKAGNAGFRGRKITNL